MHHFFLLTLLSFLYTATPLNAHPASLASDTAEMKRILNVTNEAKIPQITQAAQVNSFVAAGTLVPLYRIASVQREGYPYDLSEVSSPYLRPEAYTFMRQLVKSFNQECGRLPLTITSAVRLPKIHASVGGSPRSVHPHGLAFDVRTHDRRPDELHWLTRYLLAAETLGYIGAVEEKHNPHLHIAVIFDSFTATDLAHISVIGCISRPRPRPTILATGTPITRPMRRPKSHSETLIARNDTASGPF